MKKTQTPLPVFEKWNLEQTDTFSGEANYSYVNRSSIYLPTGINDKQLREAIELHFGYDLKSTATVDFGDSMAFYPKNICQVVFADVDLEFDLPQDSGFLDFWKGTLEALIWQSTDIDGNPIDDMGATIESLSVGDLATLWGQCCEFYLEHSELIDDENYLSDLNGCSVEEMAGHDYILTRNGHGAGFWDGDWKSSVSEILTEASQVNGQIDVDYDTETDTIFII